jgi:cell division protease FtsH
MNADNLSGGKQNVMMGGMGMNGGGSGILNELLLQMDPPPRETGMIGKLLRNLGLRRKKVDMPPVLTMGATNLAESLDAALLRPGRFDRKVYVDRPDAEGRREVIDYYLSKVKHEPMPMDRLVSDTIHYTPVAIKHVINEAVIHAHFDGRQAINYWDITRARDTHEYGLRNPIRGMSYEERRLIAYHEAGHAYTMMKLLKKERVEKVTIIRHGSALGFAAPKVIEERHLQTKEDLINNITTLLASRAAEEIFLGVKTTGVGSDFPRATYLAAVLIGAVGMEDTIYSYNLLDAQGVGAAELRPRVEKLLQTQFRYARAMLENNKEAVTAIAEALILRNELTDIDLNDILERVEAMHPFVPVKRSETRKFVGFAMPQLDAATTPPARRSRRPAAEPGALPAPRHGDTGKLPPLDDEPADSGENV